MNNYSVIEELAPAVNIPVELLHNAKEISKLRNIFVLVIILVVLTGIVTFIYINNLKNEENEL